MSFAAMDPPFLSGSNASIQAQHTVIAEMDPMASNSSPHREASKQHAFHMNHDFNGTSRDSQHDLSPRSGVDHSNSQIKVLCSFGGRIMIRPGDGKLRYHGGETRIVALDRNLSYKEFILKMADVYCAYTMLKYQLPGEDLDALVSIASDEDFQNLLDECDKLESNGSIQRLRIFLFDDPLQCEILDSCISSEDIENHSREVKYYVDTLNGIQDKMFDMHLERGMDALSPRYTHRKGRTKSDRLYSTNPFVNPFVKAASSAPSSPSFSLRKPYLNPWGIIDTPFQALEEWKNVIPLEATRDIFVDTSSTSKCDQNQGCGQSPQLHQGMGFSREEINSNAKDTKMHVTRQHEHDYEPTIVAGTWNNVKHAAGRTSVQVQSVNQQPNQRLYEIQDYHPELHKQMNLGRQPDLEGSQFHCRECYAPLQWSPEYHHKISMLPQGHKSHLQSTVSVRVVPSSSQEVCVRCNRPQQHTEVLNACVAEHTQNGSCGDLTIKRHGPLSLSSGFHDENNDLLYDCSWQQQPNPVKWLGVEEQNNTMLEERNAQGGQHEYSLRGHAPENAHNVLSKNLLSNYEPHPDHCEESQDRLEHFTDQNKSMDVDAENPFETEKPSGSFSLQVRPSDVELQNTWTNISHSKDPTMIYNYQRDGLDRSVYEGVIFTLDDSSNAGCGRSGFASDSAPFGSINDEATMSSGILLTQDLFDTLASAGDNQDLLERNADGVFSQKECLTEISHTPVSNTFCLSMPVNDDNDHEEIVDFGSFSAIAKPINVSQDTDENIIRHLAAPSVEFTAPNFGRSCSSLGASTADYDLNKDGSPDSIRCQQMRSLSWQSGALGWTNQEEALITLASPIFDESPVSSLNIENPSLKNSEESFFLDSVNWFKENISCKGEDGNERVSSVMTARPCERISERKDDDIERHCNRIFERDEGSSSRHLSRESTEEKVANGNMWEDSIKPYQFSDRVSPEGKERDFGSFCFQQLKKKSSVVEAEAEATARGLQIIKNEDLEELRVLGSGTYGTVFHGKWRGSDVAIKRIKFGCLEGCRPSVQERLVSDFWREAGTLSQLHHPNIVAFYGIVPDGPDGNLATVTEFMVNGSLKQVLLKKDRTIDRKKRLLIAMDAAFGMEYLHSKNVVHFDLKSENLLVNMRDAHRPICKVGDFGLSKVKQHTLVSGGIRGTLPWMAPELLSEKHIMVTEKIDVYSFGIVMWELLTGEEPYAHLHCGAIVGGIVNNTLRPSIPSSCDPNWRQLMEKCWAADPADRPSFAEISRELRSMAASMNIK